MRNTPSFKREKVAEGAEYYLHIPHRPSVIVGDFLENRRILSVLQKHMNMLELDGIIDNKDSLNSFYFFGGTRFIKDKINSLFDDGEYGFDNMLTALYQHVIKEIGRIYSIEDYSPESFTKFLVKFQQGDLPNLKIMLDTLTVMASESSIGRVARDNELATYSSDSVIVIKGYKIERGPRKLALLLDAKDEYASLSRKEDKFSFSLDRLKNFKHRITNKNLINSFAMNTFMVEDTIRKMMSSTIFSNYMQRLSACMNLPDDKHTELNEANHIEEWIILFETFYPKYKNLKLWYEANK